MTFGLVPCVVPKNLFLEKIAPYARARTRVNGRIARGEIEIVFLPVRNGVQIFKILPRDRSSMPTFKEVDSHNEKKTGKVGISGILIT